MKRKGIILAGGTASRLFPITIPISKQLLPVFDKPMIYYPLSTLILAGITDIQVITTQNSLNEFKKLLGDGSQFGINLNYAVQQEPKGIAEALIISKRFLCESSSAVVLGDNIFDGFSMKSTLGNASKYKGSTIFAKKVEHPEHYGVVSFSDDSKPIDIVEKPKKPKSKYAVTGLYFYDNQASEYAASLKPSDRGEYEITDLNRLYLDNDDLNLEIFEDNLLWFDAGTPRNLLEASRSISHIQDTENRLVGSPHYASLIMGNITRESLDIYFANFAQSEYVNHIRSLIIQ
tara:strand:- start:150 stop:1019 length:870 start_codon:yes stop_codon:yes gene_type:complete